MKPKHKTRLRYIGIVMLILVVVFLVEYTRDFPAYICIETLTLFIIVGLIINIGIIIYFKMGVKNVST